MKKYFAVVRNKLLQSKWLPLALAISLVFVPNSLLLIKLLGVVLALILFYQSILLDRNSSKRNLLK